MGKSCRGFSPFSYPFGLVLVSNFLPDRYRAIYTIEAAMIRQYKTLIALFFSSIFHLISLFLILFSFYLFTTGLNTPERDLISLIIKCINTLIISLAMYELGVGVGKEYTGADDEGCIFENMRRTITRFVGTVCIALVLESLIMIIKYSQLELAGNLYYPVSILTSCSFLLISLGLFLKLTANEVTKQLHRN